MKNGRKNNEEIEKLSKQQQKLKNDLESTKNSKEQHKIKKERQKIQREIRSIIRTEEDNRTSEKIEEIEKQKDDARKMFHAIKYLQKQTTPKTLLINGENGLTPNPKQQIKIITTHFQDQFHKDAVKLQEISPTDMKNQFTTEEVERALNKLKYNKSPGLDEIMIKRITGRALQYIPKTQAAYQSGRSTTEYVFAIKLLAEMAITSKDLTIYLLMLDMSKAFDTVNRVKLFTILRTFLEDDELA